MLSINFRFLLPPGARYTFSAKHNSQSDLLTSLYQTSAHKRQDCFPTLQPLYRFLSYGSSYSIFQLDLWQLQALRRQVPYGRQNHAAYKKSMAIPAARKIFSHPGLPSPPNPLSYLPVKPAPVFSICQAVTFYLHLSSPATAASPKPRLHRSLTSRSVLPGKLFLYPSRLYCRPHGKDRLHSNEKHFQIHSVVFHKKLLPHLKNNSLCRLPSLLPSDMSES